MNHWTTSKRDESFNDFIRRIYHAQKSIELETVEDAEAMRGDVRPFELPSQFLGHFICKIRCPTCNRDFQTAVLFKDFVTSGSPKTGTFTHYEDDAGCGSFFTVLEIRHMRMKVLVRHGEKEPIEAWIGITA